MAVWCNGQCACLGVGYRKVRWAQPWRMPLFHFFPPLSDLCGDAGARPVEFRNIYIRVGDRSLGDPPPKTKGKSLKGGDRDHMAYLLRPSWRLPARVGHIAVWCSG